MKFFILTLAFLIAAPAVANDSRFIVKGFFCAAQADAVEFIKEQRYGGHDNQIMAAEAVNKRLGEFTCAYYKPAYAVKLHHLTLQEESEYYIIGGYMFYPEKIVRWREEVAIVYDRGYENSL